MTFCAAWQTRLNGWPENDEDEDDDDDCDCDGGGDDWW